MWDLRNRDPTVTLKAHDRFLTKVKFSPDETQVATADEGGHIKVRVCVCVCVDLCVPYTYQSECYFAPRLAVCLYLRLGPQAVTASMG